MIKELTKVIAPSYFDVFWDIKLKRHLHYWFKGGRGSLKSSFVFILVIYLLMLDANEGKTTHCVCMRKVKDTIKDSVFTNLLWAIDLLGVSKYWKVTTSPMRLQYKDSTILFRGAANKHDYEKIKSIKVSKGFIKYGIFEELTEFNGMEEIRQILASLFRGGNEALAFYMYNPPASKNNWVNSEVLQPVKNRYVHSSTYLDAPVDWLGNVFIEEAEILKELNPRKYQHMYMGDVIGEGLEIYPNLNIRTITDEEIRKMTQIDRGLDFGYTHASCYCEAYYDYELSNYRKADRIFITDEVYLYKSSNHLLSSEIKKKAGNRLITGDSEDARTINEMNLLGLNVRKAVKGKDSKAHGIKWLSDRVEIIVDRKRTPNIAQDLELYEFQKDKEDKIIYDYPDEPDGSAALRYALEKHIIANKIRWGK